MLRIRSEDSAYRNMVDSCSSGCKDIGNTYNAAQHKDNGPPGIFGEALFTLGHRLNLSDNRGDEGDQPCKLFGG